MKFGKTNSTANNVPKGGGFFGKSTKAGAPGAEQGKGGGFSLFGKKQKQSESLLDPGAKNSKELSSHLTVKTDSKIKARSKFDRDVQKAKKKAAKQEKTEAFSKGFSFDKIALYDEFLPFAAFFDKETVITKEGDLVHTIAIPVFSRVEGRNNINVMRTYIRKAIRRVVTDSRVGVWIHTIRNRKNLVDVEKNYPGLFCESLDQIWNKSNNFTEQFVNSVYVSFVYRGVNEQLWQPGMLLGSLSSFVIKTIFRRNINKGVKVLRKISKRFLEEIYLLKPYQLGIKQDKEGHYYSDLLSVFSNIVNLQPRQEYLKLTDLSEQLADQRMRFVNNYFYVINEESNQKRYACVLSAKNSPYISSEKLDGIMQLPFHFIVSQSVDLVEQKYLNTNYEKQHYYATVSKDNDFFEGLGVEELYRDEEPDPDDLNEPYDPSNRFCFSQINVTIIGNSKEELEEHIAKLLDHAERVGWVLFREDLLQEFAFWAQFPGNFSEIRRQFNTQTLQIGEFATTFSIPFGQYEDNVWGRPIAIFKSVLDTPFFFAFHGSYKYGNTIIVGSDRYSYKEMLANFLIAEACKCKAEIFYVDKNYNAELLIRLLGGDYFYLTPRDPEKISTDAQKFTLKVNPMRLEDTPENRQFMVEWLIALASYDFDPEKLAYDDEVKEWKHEFDLVAEIVDSLYELNKLQVVTFPMIVEKFDTEATRILHEKLSFWSGDKNPYQEAFIGEEDNLFLGFNSTNAVEISREFTKLPILIKPMLLYIMHKIQITAKDELPTIIVLNGLLHLINHTELAEKYLNWAKEMEKRNCVIINITENLEDCDPIITEYLAKHNTTSIFVSHRKMLETKFNTKLFNLEDKQIDKLKYQGKKNNCFIIRQVGRGEALIDFPSSKLREYARILKPDKKSAAIFADIFYQQMHGSIDVETLLSLVIEAFKDDD